MIVLIGLLFFTALGYQNCGIAPKIEASKEPDAQIKDSRTIVIMLRDDLTKLSMKDLKIDGEYKYPTSGSNKPQSLKLSNMHLFYSCFDKPQKCELTFKIPDDNLEMDLAKIYSQSSELSLHLKKSNSPDKNMKFTFNRSMLSENMESSP